jgi:hypothetical protein
MNRMSASDWTLAQDGSNFAFRRGFTGHEHYDRFGIINMNARLYDPVLVYKQTAFRASGKKKPVRFRKS